MQAVLFKLTLNDSDSHEEQTLTAVGITLEQLHTLIGLSQLVKRHTIEGNIELDSEVVTPIWIDELEECSKLSLKELGQIETSLEESLCVVDKEIEVDSDIEVENFTIGMTEDGIYFLCEYDGQTYATEMFITEELLGSEEEDETDEVLEN